MGAGFLALVASVFLGRYLTDRAAAVEAGHDPRRCADCATLRHPSQHALRTALAVIPHQTRGGDQ
jgi:hypothetical protein